MEAMGNRSHLSPGLVTDGLRGCLQLLQGAHRQPHRRPEEVHGVVECRKGLWEEELYSLPQDPRCLVPPAPIPRLTMKFPVTGGWKTPLKEHREKGQEEKLKSPDTRSRQRVGLLVPERLIRALLLNT